MPVVMHLISEFSINPPEMYYGVICRNLNITVVLIVPEFHYSQVDLEDRSLYMFPRAEIAKGRFRYH